MECSVKAIPNCLHTYSSHHLDSSLNRWLHIYTQPVFSNFTIVLEPIFWSPIHDGHHMYLNVDNVWQSMALPTDLQHREQPKVIQAKSDIHGDQLNSEWSFGQKTLRKWTHYEQSNVMVQDLSIMLKFNPSLPLPIFTCNEAGPLFDLVQET